MSEGQIVPELLEAHSGIRIIGGAKERNHLPKGKEEIINAGFRGPAYNAADDGSNFASSGHPSTRISSSVRIRENAATLRRDIECRSLRGHSTGVAASSSSNS